MCFGSKACIYSEEPSLAYSVLHWCQSKSDCSFLQHQLRRYLWHTVQIKFRILEINDSLVTVLKVFHFLDVLVLYFVFMSASLWYYRLILSFFSLSSHSVIIKVSISCLAQCNIYVIYICTQSIHFIPHGSSCILEGRFSSLSMSTTKGYELYEVKSCGKKQKKGHYLHILLLSHFCAFSSS